jgi:undecaprenyl pyrophosphate synthase
MAVSISEIFFEKKLWPDFSEKDYIKIIKKFKKLKEILVQFNVKKFNQEGNNINNIVNNIANIYF